MTQKQLDELGKWAQSLTEPASYYDGEQDADIELGDKPTLLELKSAMEGTRTELSLALDLVHGVLEKLEKDMDKMRNHRHDTSKQFGGRPEF